MRTREKGMKDYNVPQEDYEELLKRCKKLNIEDSIHLFQCAISAAPGLEIAVYESITTGADLYHVRKMIFTHTEERHWPHFMTAYDYSENGKNVGRSTTRPVW